MGKSVADAVLDAALAVVQSCTRMDVTSDSSTPTDLSNTLANVAMASGDYTIADGSVSGRKITTAQKAGVSVTGGGTARHIVLSLAGVIKLTTTCTEQVLALNNTVTIPAFKEEIGDPT
jgi:hypothetical protein